jgi:hypothetical protein
MIGNLNLKLSAEMYKEKRWIKKKMVPWAPSFDAENGPEFTAKLIGSMKCEAFPPQDTVPANDRMFVLTAGTCFTDSLITMSSRCTVWNYDFFLHNPMLKKNLDGRTITYVQLESLERETFMEYVKEVEDQEWYPLMRFKFMWIALLRGCTFCVNHQIVVVDETGEEFEADEYDNLPNHQKTDQNGNEKKVTRKKLLPDEWAAFQDSREEIKRRTRSVESLLNADIEPAELDSNLGNELLRAMHRIEKRLAALETKDTPASKRLPGPSVGLTTPTSSGKAIAVAEN